MVSTGTSVVGAGGGGKMVCHRYHLLLRAESSMSMGVSHWMPFG